MQRLYEERPGDARTAALQACTLESDDRFGSPWPVVPNKDHGRRGHAHLEGDNPDCKDSNASLIVIGSHRHGGLMGHLVGSVAAAVMAHAASPVLVMSQRDSARDLLMSPGRYR